MRCPNAASAVVWTFALTLGCQKQPEPEKVDPKASPFAREMASDGGEDKFPNPKTDTPGAREGEQIAAAELDALIVEAESMRAADRSVEAVQLLRKCANRLVASGRCEGMLGVLISPHKSRRAEALYYLGEASRTDDPAAKPELYDEVGAKLRDFGQFEQAAAALALGLAREKTAVRHVFRGQVLSSIQARIGEAADEIAAGRALEDRDEWIYEEGVLRGQTLTDTARGADLLAEYLKRIEADPAKPRLADPETLKARISELRTIAETHGEKPKVAEKPRGKG